MKRKSSPLTRLHYFIHNRLATNQFAAAFYDNALVKMFGASRKKPSDISDHIATIYADIVGARPKLIVELGTRGGESTKTILAAAAQVDAIVLSVDIDDCSGVAIPEDLKTRWTFIKADDMEFLKSGFASWCEARGMSPAIDALFIDTSHLYEHTVAEIRGWMPFLQPNGVALFHDTNLQQKGVTYNNTILNYGWDNERGVIRAIEEFVGKKYDETKFFVDVANGWLVRHYPNSYGLTMMRRTSSQ
jgi:cephalosporin hydroxylase